MRYDICKTLERLGPLTERQLSEATRLDLHTVHRIVSRLHSRGEVTVVGFGPGTDRDGMAPRLWGLPSMKGYRRKVDV